MFTFNRLKGLSFLYDGDEGSGGATSGAQGTDREPTGTNGEASTQRFTQADLDRIAGEARASGRESVAKAIQEAGFENLDAVLNLARSAQERDEAEKSELEKAQTEIAKREKRIAELEGAIKALELDGRRRQLAAEKALPAGAIKYIQGETDEEISASIDELLELGIGQSGKDRKPTNLNDSDGTKDQSNGDEVDDTRRAAIRDRLNLRGIKK